MPLKRELERQLYEANRENADLRLQIKINAQPSIDVLRVKLWQEVIVAAMGGNWKTGGQPVKDAKGYAHVADGFLTEFDKRFSK